MSATPPFPPTLPINSPCLARPLPPSLPPHSPSDAFLNPFISQWQRSDRRRVKGCSHSGEPKSVHQLAWLGKRRLIGMLADFHVSGLVVIASLALGGPPVASGQLRQLAACPPGRRRGHSPGIPFLWDFCVVVVDVVVVV